MSSWHSYPKLYNLGHSAIKDLFTEHVIVEEKVDGSQFSFGIFNGELRCRSKGQELIIDQPEKMFNQAVETVKSLSSQLTDGWTYRAEYLQKPKHNSLAYNRIPNNHLIIFDINTNEESYLSYKEKQIEATRLGLECVPILYQGTIDNFESFISLMDKESVLGEQKMEGLVIKNYHRFGPDKKVLMGKHVSEAFKEVHKGEWKKSNPGKGDIEVVLCNNYRTEARWHKAIQHLKEKGLLTNTPKDIGALLVEVQNDIHAECEAEIKQQLYNWMMPKIKRSAIRGLPEFYKNELVKLQFEEDDI